MTNANESRRLSSEEQSRLQAAGFTIGDAANLLALTPEEDALIRTRYALTRAVRERRLAQGFAQAELAQRIGTSQSRIAKLENGDLHISTDLLLRALFATGAGPAEAGAIIAASADAAGVVSAK